jgi:hypothetical protein
MEVAKLTSQPGAAPGQRSVLRQIGRGVLALALLVQGLFSLGFGLYGVWTGVSWIHGPSYLVDWAWYQPLTVGVFLVLGGAASLVTCWTYAKDEPEPPARDAKSIALWATIAFDALLPPGVVLIGLAASPIFRTEPLAAGWAFWQLIFGLVAFGIWNYAKRPPFGWIGGRSLSLIVAAAVTLIGVAAFGAHTAANSFNSWLPQQARNGPCDVHQKPCWATVDALTAREAATGFGHPVAWLPAGNAVSPSNMHAGSEYVYEYAHLDGTQFDVFLGSRTGRVAFCEESAPCPSKTIRYRGDRLLVYPLPDGTQLELAWTRAHVHYRLTLVSIDHTSPTLHLALSLLSLVHYATPSGGEQ